MIGIGGALEISSRRARGVDFARTPTGLISLEVLVRG